MKDFHFLKTILSNYENFRKYEANNIFTKINKLDLSQPIEVELSD